MSSVRFSYTPSRSRPPSWYRQPYGALALFDGPTEHPPMTGRCPPPHFTWFCGAPAQDCPGGCLQEENIPGASLARTNPSAKARVYRTLSARRNCSVHNITFAWIMRWPVAVQDDTEVSINDGVVRCNSLRNLHLQQCGRPLHVSPFSCGHERHRPQRVPWRSSTASCQYVPIELLTLQSKLPPRAQGTRDVGRNRQWHDAYLGSVRQDDQAELHVADCRRYSHSEDKVETECYAEEEKECGQAMNIARAT